MMDRKRKKFLESSELAEMKALLRDALELPVKSHVRGEAIREAARAYDVSPSVAYRIIKHLHRTPRPRQAEASSNGAVGEVVRKHEQFSISFAGVTLTSTSKDALLAVLHKIL